MITRLGKRQKEQGVILKHASKSLRLLMQTVSELEKLFEKPMLINLVFIVQEAATFPSSVRTVF